MGIFRVVPGAQAVGHDVGILLLDRDEPRLPGDVGHAATFPYPVLYRTVPGLRGVVNFSGDERCLSSVIDAARELERSGVRVIASNCGFLLWYQHQLVTAVRVPVVLSSLLQIPLMALALGRHKAIGIITASAERLTPELLALAGASPTDTIYSRGLMHLPEFRSAFMEDAGQLDSDKFEEQVVGLAKEMVEAHPKIGAILLECSLLPPYNAAIKRATGLPVFDFVTMIDHFQAAVRPAMPLAGAWR